TMSNFMQSISFILNDKQTTLSEKIETIAEKYIDFIAKEPEVPVFIITEIRNNPKELLKKLPIKQALNNSVFFAQHKEAVEKGQISEAQPLHFLMNLIGLVVFPFIAKPI